MIKIPIKIGDTILRGKFRNKKVIVKSIGVDEHGSPTVNGKSILSIRLIQKEEQPKNKKEIKLANIAREIYIKK